jgi:hypothetical protein
MPLAHCEPWTQVWPLLSRHWWVAVQVWVAVFGQSPVVLHWTHVSDVVLHFGVGALQCASEKHWTQVLFVKLQCGVDPLQSESALHWTHPCRTVLHTGVGAEQVIDVPGTQLFDAHVCAGT